MLWIFFVVAIVVVFAALPKPKASGGSKGKERDVPKPHRGTHVVHEDQGSRLWTEYLDKHGLDPGLLIPFGNGYLLPACEAQHTKVLGAAGGGKSTAIKHLLGKVAERPEQRCVVIDPDGGYARLFFRPERGDRVLNPFDARTVRWDLAAEITQPYHAEQIAAALVPEREGGEAADFARYGQQLVSATIHGLLARGELTASALWHWISSEEDMEAYKGLVAGSVAVPFFSGGNERFFGSIRGVSVSALSGLQYLSDGDFSLSRYALSDDRGWLFITYSSVQIAALRGIIAAWARIIIMSLMSRPAGDNGMWLILDELDALGKIAGLSDALARLRKFGGRCVIACQSIGQLKAIYGRDVVAGLLENCANTLFLRCGSSDDSSTSAYASSVIGRREVMRTTRQATKTTGSNTSPGRVTGLLAGTSKSKVEGTTTALQVEDAVLPSQIEKLENLKGYVHSHGLPFWSRCTLPLYTSETLERPEGSAS